MTDQCIQQDATCYHWFKQPIVLSISKPALANSHKLKTTSSNPLNMHLADLHAPTSHQGPELNSGQTFHCAVTYHCTTKAGRHIIGHSEDNLRVRRPNQQCHRTEGQWLVNQVKDQSHQAHQETGVDFKCYVTYSTTLCVLKINHLIT